MKASVVVAGGPPSSRLSVPKDTAQPEPRQMIKPIVRTTTAKDSSGFIGTLSVLHLRPVVNLSIGSVQIVPWNNVDARTDKVQRPITTKQEAIVV